MTAPILIQLHRPPIATEKSQRIIAIGKFDGIHIAHQAVIHRAVEVARTLKLSSSLFTFDPHPRFVLTGDAAYARVLTPLQERAKVARALGVETIFAARFNRDFQQQTAKEFVLQYLLPLGARHLVVGYDFRFGKQGRYTPDDLRLIGEEYHVGVDVVQAVDFDGIPVSSSMIRKELADGRIDQVMGFLGRPYRIRGHVIQGDQRGRAIGFPTANLCLTENYVLPALGVYVVDVWIDNERKRAVMNVGRRPTFYKEGELTIEVHVLSFTGDLYGSEMIVDILHYIRGEQRFPDLAALQHRLLLDVEIAATWISPIQ